MGTESGAEGICLDRGVTLDPEGRAVLYLIGLTRISIKRASHPIYYGRGSLSGPEVYQTDFGLFLVLNFLLVGGRVAHRDGSS